MDIHADRRLKKFDVEIMSSRVQEQETRSNKHFEERAGWLNDQNNLLVQKKLDAQAHTVRILLEKVEGKLNVTIDIE